MDFIPLPEPFKLLCLLRPEGFRVADRSFIYLLIFLKAFYVRLFTEFARRIEDSFSSSKDSMEFCAIPVNLPYLDLVYVLK